MPQFQFFASAPRGVEPLLLDELLALGASTARVEGTGVAFEGGIELAYRACLWSRTASRVFLHLTTCAAHDADTLYENVKAIDWESHLDAHDTIAVDFWGMNEEIRNTQFGAQKVKDAVVDRIRDHSGERPAVDRGQPDLRIYCMLRGEEARIGIDLSGEALHRRGYRSIPVSAPLKENLAAALLIKSGWPDLAAQGASLIDPFTGSGTFPIEAAWIATNTAPGLMRDHWGFTGWKQHQDGVWVNLIAEARAAIKPPGCRLMASDIEPAAVRAGRTNAGKAGVDSMIEFTCRDFDTAGAPEKIGLVIANPPYGERLGSIEDMAPLYARFGDWLKREAKGWHAAVFIGDAELGKRMGIRAKRVNSFYNGALPCKLIQFDLQPELFIDRAGRDQRRAEELAEASAPFRNRLQKNLKHLKRWAKREGVSCYRVYDADLPEYSVAVDVYETHVHVQEYQAPSTIDEQAAAERLNQVIATIPEVLGVRPEDVYLKTRRRQKSGAQYMRRDDSGEFYEVHEGPARFLVNFKDYLDTGLFLDHRPLRNRIRELAKGQRFLNLFCYTGTASVHAALGGASTSMSVDMSRTYQEWAERNLELNGCDMERHKLRRDDCMQWLENSRGQYDLIFLDPPTVSRSKRMEQSFDVQRDHIFMVQKCMGLLSPGGLLLFSTNFRKFRMDEGLTQEFDVQNISRKTLGEDFRRNPKVHQVWEIRAR